MITAKVIQDSLSTKGSRVTTMELEYPRFIHSEFMTHRVFSRNAASSRAIPFSKMMRQVWNNPASPVEWGANNPGMRSKGVVKSQKLAALSWALASKLSVLSALILSKVGLHKQIVNRVLEPFQTMRTVVTSTEWDNFMTLRDHCDAQPEIQVLSRSMRKAMRDSEPVQLSCGDLHVPYVDRGKFDGEICYISNGELLTKQDALMVSASCCAQVNNLALDSSIDKAKRVYGILINSKPVHASPFEHQARDDNGLNEGLSGNFEGFSQYRKILESQGF